MLLFFKKIYFLSDFDHYILVWETPWESHNSKVMENT